MTDALSIELTESEQEMLIQIYHNGPARCSELGELLWGRARGSSTNPFSRPAGAIIKRLRDKSLVREGYTLARGYEITDKGVEWHTA
ncbi:hypothetical protein LCGC14_1550960 [marine sediment metagenome]|uniref:Uncharacterized protein n=1 Tax=marine sediment metagenome TaxID=412755 RepID=A0A0F9IQE0_9ZZZZ